MAGASLQLILLIGIAGCYASVGSEAPDGDVADARPDGGEGDAVREVPRDGDAETWVYDGDPCTIDEDCGDGDPCNGFELCLRGVGCVPGAPPSCDDGISCTRDSCEPATGECRSVADDELCPPSMTCVPAVGCCDRWMGCPAWCATDSDCDDGAPCNGIETCGPDDLCLPGTVPAEECNGVDDDCDGVTDEGCGPECCTDRVDNDDDGAADCDDADCLDDPACTPCREGPEICWDGCDNDLDCRTDDDDPEDCPCLKACSRCNCRPGPERCENLCDDDRDGAIDCEDSDCTSVGRCAGCVSTAAAEDSFALCMNGRDDDCDGWTDACDEPVCAYTIPGCDVAWAERCGSRLDEDLDGMTDCSDWDCRCWIGCTGIEWSPEDCDNGIDDDWDGRTDADDFDCPRSC